MNSIFLTGVATSGKDSLQRILTKILEPTIQVERWSFADNLKSYLDPFIRQHFGISAFTKDPQEKELIRGLFVEFGLVKRKMSFGKFWWQQLHPSLLESIKSGCLPCITDLRYAIYQEDEHYFAKQVMDGVIIHITRYDKNGARILPPNAHEKENDPILEALADFKIVWPTSDNQEFLEDLARHQLAPLLESIKNKYGSK